LIGIKLKGAETTRRFEAADAWNSMVTHRVYSAIPSKLKQKYLAG